MIIDNIKRHAPILWISALGLVVWPAGGAAENAFQQKDHAKYQRCIALSKANPDAAFDMALTWRDFGGGDAAAHCVAAALLGLKIYGEAARRFEALAQSTKADAAIQAGLLGHAAQAWLLAGKPNRAETILTAAIKIKADDPELLIDRAIVRADLGRYQTAAQDLTAAIKLDANRADAYVFRASAYRHLKKLDAAENDADQALRLDAYHPAGLLERGIIRRLKGNRAGARADWLQILKHAPNSKAGESAKANLANMDVNKP